MPELTPDKKSVFGRALELPAAERAAYLDAACAGHPALRNEVEELLRAHDGAGSFMNAAPPGPAPGAATLSAPGREPEPTRSHPAAVEKPGEVVAGRYKLLQLIGEGGMGAVWMADQTEPVRRRVAVKLIRADRGASGTILSRFEAERQAIALMNHPNIAKLLDAGTTDDGSPFFVMELVKGVPLTDYCDAHRLSVPERLGLFRQICSAVHHAHQKGVIHRDLKPTNILVESHDGNPVPRVIDFGLAKATTGMQLTEHTLFTAFGTVAGTPLYMAPEQATFNAIDVDSRVDIYALGVILYELLAGSTPIPREALKTAALDEMLRVIREQEPPPPSSRISTSAARPSIAADRRSEPSNLGRFVRGELDWIVMKALAKERDRRYESATALAADVERFLNHEPVSAGPPSQWYRVRKFVRRNKGRVTAAALVLVTLVAGVVGTSVGLFQADRARRGEIDQHNLAEGRRLTAVAERDEKIKALAAEQEARVKETEAKNGLAAAVAAERQAAYDLTIPLVQKALQENDPSRAAALLASCPEDLRGWEWNFLSRRFEWGVTTLRPGYSRAQGVSASYQFTGDGKLLVAATPGAHVRTRNGTTGEPISEWNLGANGTTPLGDTSRLSPDGTIAAVWYAARQPAPKSKQPRDPPADTTVTLVSTDTGKPLAELKGSPQGVRAVLFSSDGSRVATCGYGNEVRVWDRDGKLLRTLTCEGRREALPVAFTADAKTLVVNAAERLTAEGITPAGNGEFRVWNLETGTTRATGVLYAYQDTKASTGGKDLQVVLPGGGEPYTRLSPDGRYAMGIDSDVFKFVADLTTGKEVYRFTGGFHGLGFLPDGAALAINADGVCAAFDLPSGATRRSYALGVGDTRSAGQLTRTADLSPDGRWLTLYHQMGGTVEVRAAETGRVVRAVSVSRYYFFLRGSSTTLAPDGTRLLTFAQNGEMKLWDLRASVPARSVPLESGSTWAPVPAGCSHDGRLVAVLVTVPDSAQPQSTVQRTAVALVDLATGTSRVLKEDLGTLGVRFSGRSHVVFSPDGRKVAGLASSFWTSPPNGGRPETGASFIPLVLDVETGAVLVRGAPIVAVRGSLDDTGGPQVAFTADGTPILARVVRQDGSTPVWRIESLAAEGAEARALAAIPAGEGSSLRLSADGRFAALLGRSHDTPAVAMWDVASGRALWSVPPDAGQRGNLEGIFSGDGTRLLVTNAPMGNDRGRPSEQAPRAIVYESPSGREASKFRAPATFQRQGLGLSHDGRRVFWYAVSGGRAVLINADTGRELLADFDLGDGLNQFGLSQPLVTPDGRLITSRAPVVGKKIDRTAAVLRVWDGRKGDGAPGPAPTVDDWLAEAMRFLGDSDPAKRNPTRALDLMTAALRHYPRDPECQSARAWALVQLGRHAEAVEALRIPISQIDGVAPVQIAPQPDGSRMIVPTSVTRRAAEFFLMALATHGTGQRERARVWFSWGETALRCPNTPGPKAPPIGRPTDTTPEVERARAEPFRREAARVLGLPFEPIVPIDIYKTNIDYANPGNRMMGMCELARRGDPATAIWGTEYLLKISQRRPEPHGYYNAACVYSLASGSVADRREEYATRAVELLRQAIGAGYRDVAHIKQDEDFVPLRDRADFKVVVSQLEAKYPPPEVAPPPRERKRPG